MLKWLQGGGARERQPRRVAVIDTVQVDSSRSVVLIRRDNIEHLLLIGGPTDVVIEFEIVRTGARVPAQPARSVPARLTAEFSNRLTPSEVPRSATSRVSAPKRAPSTEPLPSHKLQELTRQLEAALSRSPAPQGRPPVTDPLAFPTLPPPPTVSASSVAQPDAPLPEFEPSSEPRLDAQPEPKNEPKIEPKFEPPKPQPKGEPAELAGKKTSDIL